MSLRIVAILGLLLFPASYAFADEGHSHENNLSEDIELFMNGEESTNNGHDAHNMSPEEHSNMTETESSGHNDSGAEGGHGHGTEVFVETPPNYTILSVFGAINLSFLVVGLVNKRFRKRVEINGNAGKTT